MQIVNVQLDISTPAGKQLLRELKKHPTDAKIEYPLPEGLAGQKTYSHIEVFEELVEKLNDHYDTNYKLKC